ncbi:hypothetical protein GCM10010330_15830 [Streptomyces tendae]|uniref:hypothetical protein n=1 Tax=Streptomyces tendae TaxID=1932 RepID=UPI001675E1A2|nr:hypothetical protein [Streptomyces tendae]GHA63864.1 hypothetical protein GCM10010330_15830 [Streptomyces tendae]
MIVVDIGKSVEQLDELIEAYAELVKKSKWDDASDLPSESRVLLHRVGSAINRVTAPNSIQRKQLEFYEDERETSFKLAEFVGVAEALRDDLKAGWTESFTEQVHADMHGDYLEMAGNLLSSGHKDAAAVIAGTALEVHVRSLCVKHGVGIEDSNGSPKKATTMNADLKKADVYATLQEKQVTAWMDLRNQAAHGNYEKYNLSEVRVLIDGVRGFMLKYPA